ncbi:hypothetical protein AA0X95_20260 [Bacillus sp. 1P10SD]|uniref:hypothetical protein n=1 Tax=Bacillus sp. 1P10SD TaxID=3132265 RepID=UPI0039A519B3
MSQIENHCADIFVELLEGPWYLKDEVLTSVNQKQKYIDEEYRERKRLNDLLPTYGQPRIEYKLFYQTLLGTVSVEKKEERKNVRGTRERNRFIQELYNRLLAFIFHFTQQYYPYFDDEDFTWTINDEEVFQILTTAKNSVLIEDFLKCLAEGFTTKIIDTSVNMENPLKEYTRDGKIIPYG